MGSALLSEYRLQSIGYFMTQFKTQQERDAAARALMAPNQNQAQQAAPNDPSWANWFSNRFTAENAMNIPYNAYAIGSNAIGAGINGARYFLDPDTAPHPTQRQVDPRASWSAFDAAGLAATGGIAATGAAMAVRVPMVPKGAVGSNAVPDQSRYLKQKYYHGTDHNFGKAETFDTNTSSFDAVFTSPRDFEAAEFGKNVIPLNVRDKKFFDYRNPEDLNNFRTAVDGGEIDYYGDPLGPSTALPSKVINDVSSGHYGAFENPSMRAWLDRNGYAGWHEVEELMPTKKGVSKRQMTEDLRNRPNLVVSQPNTLYRENGDLFFSSGIPGLYATVDYE